MGYFRPLSQTKFINDSSLLAYYKLEDTADSKGSYTLTNTNTVGFSTGLFANCADTGTSNSNKSLSRDDAYGMLGSTAKTYTFWGRANVAPSSGVSQIFFRHLFGGSAVGNYANVAYENDSGTLKIRMDTSPTTARVAYTMTVGQWYHFAIVVPANNTGNITCYVNGVSILTVANWSQNYALTTRFALFADHALTGNSPLGIDDFAVFNKVFSAGEVNELYQSATLGEYVGAGSGVTKALYHLNGSSADSSGNGNNGTDTAVTYSLANGKFGMGAGFAGNGYIATAVTPTANGTISLWYKSSTNSTMLVVGSDGALAHQRLVVDSHLIYMTSYDSAGNALYNKGSTTAIDTGAWFNITWTWGSAGAVLYINGKSENTSASTSYGNTGLGYYIGVNYNNGGTKVWYLTGNVDEVIIENYAWSAEQVKKYYTFAKGRFGI